MPLSGSSAAFRARVVIPAKSNTVIKADISVFIVQVLHILRVPESVASKCLVSRDETYAYYIWLMLLSEEKSSASIQHISGWMSHSGRCAGSWRFHLIVM